MGLLVQQQTPPILISRALPDAFVGYFSLSERIAQVPIGMIWAVTEMLNPLAAEYAANRKLSALGRIGILGNRYGFLLYAPIALLLLAWGTDIIRLWIDVEYATHVGPLLPYFVLGTWIALAGQGTSVGLLFGIRAHKWCAWGFVGEATAVTLASIFLLDESLVLLAQCVCAAMIANRGLLSAWALCRQLQLSFGGFLWSIYGVPSLLALPVYLLLRQASLVFPEKSWLLVMTAGAVSSLAYLLPAYVFCIDKDHQRSLAYWFRGLLRLPAAG
jgi:O-antigen/teichoic acid export membrane protein